MKENKPFITIEIFDDRIDGTVDTDGEQGDKLPSPYVLVGLALVDLLLKKDKKLYALLTKQIDKMFTAAKELEEKNVKTKKD